MLRRKWNDCFGNLSSYYRYYVFPSVRVIVFNSVPNSFCQVCVFLSLLSFRQWNVLSLLVKKMYLWLWWVDCRSPGFLMIANKWWKNILTKRFHRPPRWLPGFLGPRRCHFYRTQRCVPWIDPPRWGHPPPQHQKSSKCSPCLPQNLEYYKWTECR